LEEQTWKKIGSQFPTTKNHEGGGDLLDSNAALECWTQMPDSIVGPNYAQSPAALKNKLRWWLALKQLR
jgi:hypothetical protein